jgi:hypothetical protein
VELGVPVTALVAQFRRWWPCSWKVHWRRASPGWPTAPGSSVWIKPNVRSSGRANERIPGARSTAGRYGPGSCSKACSDSSAHPHDGHRYYLSFVATRRPCGQGIGEQLLAQNLELIDAEHFGLPRWTTKNLERYGRLG